MLYCCSCNLAHCIDKILSLLICIKSTPKAETTGMLASMIFVQLTILLITAAYTIAYDAKFLRSTRFCINILCGSIHKCNLNLLLDLKTLKKTKCMISRHLGSSSPYYLKRLCTAAGNFSSVLALPCKNCERELYVLNNANKQCHMASTVYMQIIGTKF